MRQAAGKLREQFIAILGHDLRNPLHAVYTSGDMLERRLADPQLLAFVSRIKTNARRMSALIDDVLDFARGRSCGGIGLELTEVENINTGLAAVVQELRDAQPESEIISHIGVSGAVRCDLGRLQQVASNLTRPAQNWPASIAANGVAASRVGVARGFHLTCSGRRAHSTNGTSSSWSARDSRIHQPSACRMNFLA